MSDDPVVGMALPPSVGALAGADGSGNAKAQGEEVKRLAQEFEALLMTQMMRDMRKSMLSGEEEDGDARTGALMDTADAEVGRALSRAGGFGLTDVLLGALRRQVEGATSGDASGAPSGVSIGAAAKMAMAIGTAAVKPSSPPRAVTTEMMSAAMASAMSMGTTKVNEMSPAASDAMASVVATGAELPASSAALIFGGTELPTRTEPVQPGGRVTSGFGWRSDPLTGALRFHSGVDIAMAYGHDVQAAAPGRVVFAGRSGDYGNMIVIDHGDGQQTRYAHLAQPLVQEGDVVDAGQIIGKSGNTGRVTGPHLHFEVLSNGRAVDPAAEEGRP